MTQKELNKQLFSAVQSGNVADVRSALEAGADVNAKGPYNWTSLMEAAEYGDIAMIKLLLEYGADPKIADSDGNTALMNACYYVYTEAVRLLLDAGADKDAADEGGNTSVIMACKYPRGKRKIIEALCAAGAELDAINIEDKTALMYLSFEGHTSLMKLLIKAGADPHIRDKRGRTALDILKECHPEKYERWMQNTVVKAKKKNLKMEDSFFRNQYTPDFNI